MASTAPALRVAVVEDEPFVRLDIELALQTAGHDVVGAADTADGAVELARLQNPDIMIMDVRLHGARDGIDAAIEIWQRFGYGAFLPPRIWMLRCVRVPPPPIP